MINFQGTMVYTACNLLTAIQFFLVVYFTMPSQWLDYIAPKRMTSEWWIEHRHPCLKHDWNPRSNRPSDQGILLKLCYSMFMQKKPLWKSKRQITISLNQCILLTKTLDTKEFHQDQYILYIRKLHDKRKCKTACTSRNFLKHTPAIVILHSKKGHQKQITYSYQRQFITPVFERKYRISHKK
jgi:hypothetical protein